MIEKKQLKKVILGVLLVYCICALVLYAVGREQLSIRVNDTGEMVTAQDIVGELVPGVAVVQPFAVDAQTLKSISFLPTTFGRVNTSTLTLQVVRQQEVLWQGRVLASELTDWSLYTLQLQEEISVFPNEQLSLVVQSLDAQPGNAVSIARGSSIVLPRVEVPITIEPERELHINNMPTGTALCFRVSGNRALWFGKYYVSIAFLGLSLLLAWAARCIYCFRHDRQNQSIALIGIFHKYYFLIAQLVKRDFKTKYKRSVLGVMWSFLNPLLTMLVQYTIFSTLFKSGVENYPVYLLSGIIIFGFYSEVTSLTLTSIVGNANLITKVYVPKFIYPLSRALSSLVNFLISLLPLMVVLLITKTPITPAFLLLPYGIVCLFMLSMGVALILSATMVFFRDVQFLWGVVSMLWMYLTPIFYPDTIIPAQYYMLYKMNPLYHFIKFVRTILIDGVSPPPYSYAYCFIFGAIPLLIGILFFKKTEDKFILHL